MPRVPISEDYRPGDEKFEKLKPETGEFVQFWMPELPWQEWRHELRAIVIENGAGVKETKTRRDNTTYEDWKMESVGRPFCLGDQGALADKGADPANCPACAAGHKPVPRYAVNIVKYELVGGRPRVPFGASIVIWSFTAKMYGELLDLQRGHGDLRYHDLTIRCEDGYWQRNKLGVSLNAYCLGNSEAQAFVRALWNEPGNRATDEQLKAACGSERTREQVLSDVGRIANAARQAAAAGSVPQYDPTNGAQPGAARQDLGAGLDALLGTASAAQVLPEPSGHAAAVTAQADALFGGQPAAPAAGPLGGLEMFMTEEQKAAAIAGIQAAKAEARQDMAAMADPFATLAATGATTTPTAAPAAASPSPTAPSAAQGAPVSDPFAALNAPPASTSGAAASTQAALPSSQPPADPFAVLGNGAPPEASPQAVLSSSGTAAPAQDMSYEDLMSQFSGEQK